jgi:hypothetical protein
LAQNKLFIDLKGLKALSGKAFRWTEAQISIV